jgi:glutamate-1-semialdehyde 2,1-aminomutase
MTASAPGIERQRLRDLTDRERQRFADRNPRSRDLYGRTRRVLLDGVPMSWMTMWAGAFPLFVREAYGSRLVDVDGHTYLDFCLGDSAAMAGHAPEPVAAAVERRFRQGATAMLPTEDAAWVGEELARRFGLEVWQFALTATDANRWVLRMARHITGRSRILVFNHCYHGTVDEANLILDADGRARTRSNNIGPAVDPRETTDVVEWNDVAALERALESRDVACVIAEPALTNIGIVLPEAGYHSAIRELTRSTGTLLVIDETHTFSTGPGGCTAAYELDPDVVTLGKAIAGGIPLGAYGVTRELAARLADQAVEPEDTGVIGGTLAGNALAMAAARATLEHVLTEEAFGEMIALAGRFTADVDEIIRSRRLPWHVVQLGARAEYRFCTTPPRNGGESAAAADGELDGYLHCYLLNRGVLITPFHNMVLMSPATSAADVEAHTVTLGSALDELLEVPGA